ncbi:MAG: phosphodiester glycosidase family protein [Clostridia bacterium]|nr:phosphodiester glycosidase family protein [Clostridia bacterium]
MKKLIFKAMTVMILCCILVTGYTVASSAVAEIYDEKFIYGTDVAEREDFNVVNGVTESHIVTRNDDGTGRVHNYVLEIDMKNTEIGILTSYKDYMNGLGKAEWGMQALRDQAVEVEDYYRNTLGEEDFEVVAGVNGDFFDMGTGAPTGTLIMNGKKYNVNKKWPFFAILKDGSCVIGERGDTLPKDAMQVIGGPEVLIKNGEFTEAINTSGYGVEPHPRTAIGIKADGNVVMLVSDGRQDPESCGQTFHQLAEAMLALGCVDALCLDGGGSATFISQRDGEDYLSIRNSPSDGIERTVSTGLLIYTNKDTNNYSKANKWFKQDGKVGYYNEKDVPVTGKQTIDGKDYTFGADGALNSYAEVNVDGTLAKNKWVSAKYYLGDDGLPVKGTHKIGNTTFVFNEKTGVLEKSDLKNKWCECGESICYFDENGNKVTGEKKIGQYTYPFDNDGKLNAVACAKDDGTLVKNQWFGKTYYLGENGLPRTGKIKIGSYIYSFDNEGKLIKGALSKEGNHTFYYIGGEKQRNWHMIDGHWYYFDRQTGMGMATGANCDKVSIDFDRTDGLYTVCTTDAMLLFKFDNSGKLVRGAWLETDYGRAYYWGNHERVVGWTTIEGDRYFFNNDTYAVTGKQMINGVMYSFSEDGKLEHTYTTKKYVEPTCTKEGYGEFICECGDVYKPTFEATGHKYSSVETPSTCTVMGIKTKTCKICAYREVEYLPLAEHNYTKKVTPSTCVEKGFTTYTCVDCADTKTGDFVDATGGHNYKKKVTAPTCTEKGFTTFVCSVCRDTKKDNYVDATGHSFIEKEVIAPTADEKGYTVYNCSVCDYTYNGNYVGALNHTYDAVVTPPTCTEDGYTTYTCNCGCGDSYVNDYVKASHSYKETGVVNATCTENGYTSYVCTVCDETKQDNIVAATGHDFDVVVKEPDCLNGGSKTSTCKVCGEVIVEDEVAAKGHKFETVVTEPTTQSQGYTTHTCFCGYSYVTDYKGAIGHEYTATVTPPTCTEKGYTTYVCKTCKDDTYVADYVDATGHDYVSVVTEPTCTESGFVTYACACGESYKGSEIAPTGHAEGVWTVVKPAEIGVPGKEEKKCVICSVVLAEREIKPLEDGKVPNPEIGDVNADGKISAADARLALRISAKLEDADGTQMITADYNKDGKITAADARKILRKSAKLEP